MRAAAYSIASVLRSLGVDAQAAVQGIPSFPIYLRDLWRYWHASRVMPDAIPIGSLYPVLTDQSPQLGRFARQYLHQDLWAARHIYRTRPLRHIDVASRVDGFVTHLLVFRTVEVVDIRPMSTAIEGLLYIQDDATELGRFADDSVSSISSLHAAEHFGLGRYGDPVDPGAHMKFLRALQRVLAPGGRLYFSTLCGRERCEFNAHRVFAPSTILRAFDQLHPVEISAILDDGRFHCNVPLQLLTAADLSCGLFVFEKPRNSARE
jgi:SAM-dependent methyltransferase